MPRNAIEFIGTCLVKNVKILIFFTDLSYKALLPSLKFPFDLYDVANKLGKPVFESCRKCAFYAVFKKGKVPQISTSFFKNNLKLNKNDVICVL